MNLLKSFNEFILMQRFSNVNRVNKVGTAERSRFYLLNNSEGRFSDVTTVRVQIFGHAFVLSATCFLDKTTFFGLICVFLRS